MIRYVNVERQRPANDTYSILARSLLKQGLES
jgi:hypothetical protein